ncbi:MAG: hypothetical protein ABSG62_21000 [Terracidiphilus sp.]
MRLRCLHCVSPVLVCLSVFPLHAQSTAPSGPIPAPLFKANAQAVAVDVVVTRGNDEPVLALRRQDFQVLEDGKPQAIDLFEEHTAAGAPAVTPQRLPPYVFTNLPAARRATR